MDRELYLLYRCILTHKNAQASIAIMHLPEMFIVDVNWPDNNSKFGKRSYSSYIINCYRNEEK